jgi:malonate-semialdehyde dehydrogenase (acetylating)/methylmalonate-semialdehyde dehydrogenase
LKCAFVLAAGRERHPEEDFMNAAQLSPLGSDNSLVTHWIGGSRSTTSPARRSPVFNPAQGRQVREVALATAAEVDAAVQSAAGAFRAWADVPPPRRARVMFRFQELLNQNVKRIARALSE